MKLIRVLMPPPAFVNTKYVVTLTEAERADLTRLTTTGRTAARTILHAHVLLKADAAPGGPRWTDEQIRNTFSIGFTAIARVRRRFVEEGLAAARHRRPARTPRPHAPPARPDCASSTGGRRRIWWRWRAARHRMGATAGRWNCSPSASWRWASAHQSPMRRYGGP